MKGQSTIEFLGSMFLFLVAVVAALVVMSDRVGDFVDDADESSRNVETYRVTNTILTASGSHSYGMGGENWEKNSSTISEIDRFGLAQDYHVINRSKLDAAIGPEFNNTQFSSVTNLDNEYFFNFTWFPVVETSESFTRTFPPNATPDIEEPGGNYSNAENRVHYGSFRLDGSNYTFLVVGFEGVYDTVYFDSSGSWNFEDEDRREVGDNIVMDGKNFTIEKIQNRRRTPGASFILSRPLGSFGDPPSFTDTERLKLNSYASLAMEDTEREIVRMEVFAW
jgi:hypothetical protein